MSNTSAPQPKIVLTGPESTGKTALAEDLANQLGVASVPEFARYFLEHLGRPYLRTDLETIGRGQLAWEQWYAARKPALLVCDTDWTVLQIWEHYRFGEPPTGEWNWEKGYTTAKPADLYLLCAPDFPWQPDALREHPEERDILFEWYQQLLIRHAANYQVLTGPHTQRLQTALAQVRKLL